jgi:hypothetical protein
VISGCTLTGFTYNKDHKNDWTYAREAIQLETAWTNNENDLEDQASAWANGIVIDGTVCDDITVSNNKILEFPCGVGQHHYTESGAYRNTNITIKNNTITCSAKWKHCKTAITCGGMNHVKISGNRIKGPYRFAIHVTESNDVTLQKNKIQNIKWNAIMVDSGNRISILKNNIKNTKNHAISVMKGTIGNGKSQKTGIIGNTIQKTGANGICITNGTVSAINHNKVHSVKNNGISVLNKTKVYHIKGNKFSKCKGNNIWCDNKKLASTAS